MMQLKGLLLICASLLLVAPAMARIAAATDGQALERQWQAYSLSAAQSQPSLDFPYAHCFRQAAMAHDLPETLLLAVARGESNFKPAARSDANAYGLMQILWPGTARHLGLKQLSELLEPCTNVEAGARYLKELRKKYQGNLHRTLAAYNYGPGRIPVSGGRLPKGAVWYSGYIMRHLEYVLHGGKKDRPGAARRPYSAQQQLFIIRFSRPYRAAAFIASLQPRFGEIRLDWFRRPDEGFDVVMLYTDKTELQQGKQLLSGMGF